MFLTLKGANGLNGLALNNWFSSRKQFTARGTKSLTSYFPQKRKGSLNSPVFPDHRKAQPKILSANLWEKCRFSFDLYWVIQGAMKRMKSKLYLQLCNWQKKKKVLRQRRCSVSFILQHFEQKTREPMRADCYLLSSQNWLKDHFI